MIYLAVRRHTNQIQTLQIHQEEAQNGEMATAARLRKSATGTFYVYLVLDCYLPEFFINTADISTGFQSTLSLNF